MFFTFDGIDGAGKSTQIDLFVAWLQELGHDVATCRDPGTTELGEAVRAILLGAEFPIDYRSEMLLYMACRAQMVDEFIRPSMKEGKVVVSDRYTLSSVVYQGFAGGIESDEVWRVGEIATQNLLPDLTFVLDIEPEAAAARVGAQKDRLEKRGLEYFTKVRNGFLEQAKRFPETHAVIDASQSIEQIHAAIRNAAKQKLNSTTS